MLNVFECPRCQKRFETNQETGEEVACPHCDEEFTLRRSHAVQTNTAGEAIARVAIPIGYVLFVAVPLGLTIWYFATRDAGNDEPEPELVVVEAPQAEKKAPSVRPRPLPRPPRKDRPVVDPVRIGEPEPETDPKPEPEPRPEPEPKVVTPVPTIAVAPLPREIPLIAVAPLPREIVWKVPYLGYESKWQTVGAVDLRIAGVAVTRVPYLDPKGEVRETAAPVLVIAVEARASTESKKRELHSWTHGRNRYSAAFMGNDKVLPFVELPLGARFHTGLPLVQPMPSSGMPVRDLLVYALPPDGSGELNLRLDGDRCGEPGDIWFKIPESAWKK